MSEAARADDALSQVFSALADPTRRDIVQRLAEGDATVSELAAGYDVSLQAVSKHLKVLGAAGLVRRAGESQRSPVQLDAEVFDLMTKWIERYRRHAEERYQRLDRLLAELPDDLDPLPPASPTSTSGRTDPGPGATT
jgi:DNA-binding transcriptional ArsR family regulator